MLTNLRKNWLILVVIILLISCQKDSYNPVPYVYVNLELGVYTDLAYLGVGTIATITRDTNVTGLSNSIIDFNNKNFPKIRLNQRVDGNGIMIYREAVDHFFAFDLTCTYRAQQDYCRLKIDGLLPTCPCCKSRFIINSQDGDFIPSSDSKATVPLKQYQAALVSNGSKLLITN